MSVCVFYSHSVAIEISLAISSRGRGRYTDRVRQTKGRRKGPRHRTRQAVAAAFAAADRMILRAVRVSIYDPHGDCIFRPSVNNHVGMLLIMTRDHRDLRKCSSLVSSQHYISCSL